MNAPRPLAVILASGGLDSTVAIAMALRDFDPALLHADYGQRTQERESRAFSAIADFYGVPAGRRQRADFRFLGTWGGSALTDTRIGIPKDRLGEAGPSSIPMTYVPFRNAQLLSAATAWAEILGARAIFIGAVSEDGSGYPDCRPEFYAAFQRAIERGTRPESRIEIRTPVIDCSKAEIVRRGLALGAPLHLTWSCYEREDRACGHCDSCLLRLRGFREAGAVDPIPYA